MRFQRENEIMSQLTACSKAEYHSAEILSEELLLQNQIVNQAFNEIHAENSDLRITDVDKHLEELNVQKGNIADEELAEFRFNSKIFSNNIKGLISGKHGEKNMLKALENLKFDYKVMRNVELGMDDCRTEIDAIVFTNRNIFIIEVKNTKKDIVIDEQGNLYYVGDSLKFNCNIANKMKLREDLVRKAIENTGIEKFNIVSLLVFTNKYSDIECRYHDIKPANLSSLCFRIEKYKGEYLYSDENICTMIEAVTEASERCTYPLSFDAEALKLSFAKVMAKLEETEAVITSNVTDESTHPDSDQEINANVADKPKLHFVNIKQVGITAAAVAIVNFGVAVAVQCYKRRKK